MTAMQEAATTSDTKVWSKGERAWVLNGRRTSAFPATVICVKQGVLTVFNKTKERKQLFDAETGVAIHPSSAVWKGEPPLCVPYDDQEALLLNAERQTALVGETVRERAGSVAHAVREGESKSAVSEKFAALRAAVDDWESLVGALYELEDEEVK